MGLCPGDLCPEGSLSRRPLSEGSLSRGGSLKLGPIIFGSNTLTLRLEDNFLTCNVLCMSIRKIR